MTIDAITDKGSVTAGTVTIAHTNAGNFIIVDVGVNAATVTGATYNGVAMTQAGADVANTVNGAVWTLKNPAIGLHDCVVTLSSSQESVCRVASFFGVDQTTPIGTVVADHYTVSGSVHQSHATASVAGGLVWDSFTINGGSGAVTTDAGQTNQAGPTAVASISYVSSTKPGAASVTTGYTWINDFTRWVQISVPINPDNSAFFLMFP